eukprot:190973_1
MILFVFITLFMRSYDIVFGAGYTYSIGPYSHHVFGPNSFGQQQHVGSLGQLSNGTNLLTLWFYKSKDDSMLRYVDNYDPCHVQIRQKKEGVFVAGDVTFHTLPSLLTVQLATALSPTFEYRHGDIIKINNLNKQINSTLQQITRFMNNSYGIVMEGVIKVIRNKTCIALQWILSNKTRAAINPKYLGDYIPNIYVYENPSTTSQQLISVILLDELKNVVVLINELSQILDYAPNEIIGPITVYSCALQCLGSIVNGHGDLNLPKLLNTLALLYYHTNGLGDNTIWGLLLDWKSSFLQGGGSFQIGRETHYHLAVGVNYHLARKIYRVLNECLKNFNTAMSRVEDDNTEKHRIVDVFYNTVQASHMGMFLRRSAYKKFWTLFYHEFKQILIDIINGLMMGEPLQQGTSITLDIVNTYLMNSTQDLHVICSEQSVLDKLHYDVIVEELSDHLKLNISDRFKTHMAKAIVKRVTS